MIKNLYSFTAGLQVSAEEWNTNFKVLGKSNSDCREAITDANNALAFDDSELTDLFKAINSKPNSFMIPGNTVVVAPESEYYKTLTTGEELAIQIPKGMNSEARIWIMTLESRTLLPFSVLYDGEIIINYDKILTGNSFRAGYYMISIYETNGVAQVKLIWTGA